MIRDYTACIAATTLFLTMGVAQGQTAQISVSMAARPSLSTFDLQYDFDLYARSAVPKTQYFIVYTLADGSTSEVGPIESYDSATRQIFFNYEHDRMPAGTVDAEIESRQVLDPFTKFARYDTFVQALTMADQLDSYGLESDIRWIRVVTFNSTTLKRRIVSP